MIIAGMNKYFSRHGRIIGLVIVLIISVTFVLYFGGMSVFDSLSGQGSSQIVLLGRKVTLKDRQEEVKKYQLRLSIHNPGVDLTRNSLPIQSSIIIENLLQSYAAEDLGIVVGDKAVEDYIRNVRMFQTAGKYDSSKYESYVKNKLKPAYYKQQDLKDAVREMLEHQALRTTVTESVIVPEEEIREAYTNLYMKVDAKLLTYNSSDFIKNIKLPDTEMENYFKSNKDKYKTPPAARGKMVFFSYDTYKKQAEKLIKEEDMKKYYEDNKVLYIKQEDPTKKKSAKKPKKPEYEPYEKVKDEIMKELAKKKAESIALHKAQKFADNVAVLTSDVFYDINDKTKAQKKCLDIFAKEASKLKLNVKDSGWLYEGIDNLPGFGKEEKVVETMSSLFDDNPVSEAIKGKKGVYVAILEAKKGPEARTFDQVKNKVKNDLLKSKALLLARESARTVALEVSQKLDKGEKLEAIEKELKIKFKKLQPVTAMMPPFIPNGNTVQNAAFQTPEGKISKVENTKDGALIVYVVKKNKPTESEFNKQKTTFSAQYKRMKRNSCYQNYISALMDASNADSTN